MIRYDFLEVWWVILSIVRTDSNLTFGQCLDALGANNEQILTNFTVGKFSVARKIIINGGAIRPRDLFLNLVVVWFIFISH